MVKRLAVMRRRPAKSALAKSDVIGARARLSRVARREIALARHAHAKRDNRRRRAVHISDGVAYDIFKPAGIGGNRHGGTPGMRRE